MICNPALDGSESSGTLILAFGFDGTGRVTTPVSASSRRPLKVNSYPPDRHGPRVLDAEPIGGAGPPAANYDRQEETMFQTVYEAFLASAAEVPEQPLLAVPAGPDYAPNGLEVSYAEAQAWVEALTQRYRAAGYGPGHRVGLLFENRPEHLLHVLALNAIGASEVPVNPDYTHDEMLYQMDHSEADLVVCLAERVPAVERVAGDRTAKPLPVVDGEHLPEALPGPARPALRSDSPGRATEAALLYTSGTTGRPKGCILTNDYWLTAGQWYVDLGRAGGRMDIRLGAERLINPLPVFHMNAGAVSFTCVILAQGCLIVPDRFHPTRWWEDVVSTRATIMHYLGIMPPVLLNQPQVPAERGHRLKFGLGAGIEPQLHQTFEERFGVPLIEVWGMTEVGRMFADHVEPRQVDTRAFGKPFGGFEAMVVDDQDREVPRGTPGELVVRVAGPDPRRGFFAGYLKNEQATEEAWRSGWFHTGDTVTQGEDGMLYFVDRKKNIIRRSGENIAAAEVEAVMQEHEAVAQVAVIAVPDELREEEVMACIVPMPGITPDSQLADAVFAWTYEKLAYYKPPGWILFVDSLPTTGTQKVQKTQIFPVGDDPRQRRGVVDLRQRKKRRRTK
jgi:crotonobetaine/carnitine-CoA ligase